MNRHAALDQAELGDSNQSHVSKETSPVLPVITLADAGRPTGLAMLLWSTQPSGGGGVYMCDRAGHYVDVVDHQARPLFSFGGFGSAAGQFNEPTDVVVVSAIPLEPELTVGRALLAVADRRNHRVQIFEPDGVLLGILDSAESSDRGGARRPGDVTLASVPALVLPSRLEWRPPYLDIMTAGGQVIRVDLGAAVTRADASTPGRTHTEPAWHRSELGQAEARAAATGAVAKHPRGATGPHGKPHRSVSGWTQQ